MLKRVLLLAAVAIGSASPTVGLARQAPGQSATAPSGDGLIIGRVIDGTTGATVTGVVVTIGGPGAPRTGNMVIVDSRGRFMFSGLAAGSFTLVAQKNGYLTGAYGRARPGGQAQSLVLRGSERVTDVTMRVWRTGSIDGRVLDEAGEPVSGALIYAFARTWVGGHASLSTNYSDTTDDRGVYHLGRLPPGEYVVGMTSRLTTYPIGFVEADAADREANDAARQARSAELQAKGSAMLGTFSTYPSPRIGDLTIARADGPITPVPSGNERLSIFPITFYPSAPTTDLSTPVVLAAGEQRTGADLRVRLTPTMKISGTATGPGGPIANLGLLLQLGAGSEFWSRRLVEPAQAVTDSQGRFTFLGVPPGAYTIVAAMTSQGEAASVHLPVAVGERDLTDVSLILRPNPRVSGRVEFEGTSDRPAPQTLMAILELDPADGHFERQAFRIDAAGNIAPRSVLPGTYFVHVDIRAPQTTQMGAWALKSALVDGRDVSDTPLTIDSADINGLVITLSDHAATLAGAVRDAQGAADPTATVLIFPTARARWVDYGSAPRRMRSVRPDRTGAFVVPALPAGEYFAIAVPDEVVGDWQRPTFLEKAAAAATRVKIDDGKNATIDLRTVRW